MLNLFFIITTLLSPVYSVSIDYSKVEAVEDEALGKRLTETKIYITKSKDNLVKVAYRVYGHRTWWHKIKKLNPELAKKEPYSNLPEQIKIKYLAPLIGAEYIVQNNDTLSRLSEWKYGDLELWKDIYSKNKAAIENPDIIEPGELLSFGNDGTIKNVKTGEIIVEGLDVKKHIVADVPLKIVKHKESMEEQFLRNGTNAKEIFILYKNKIIGNRYYLATLIIIILMILVFIYITYPRRIDHYTQNESHFNDHTYSDDLNLRPNYFSLLKRWWKKYLVFFINKKH